jgi:HPt (histidine-containing phosphotransfer) domain-containing protein
MADPAVPERAIDFAHLDKYTGGDARLNAEIFQLFAQHCAETLRVLDTMLDTPERKAWREAAHSLKGAALGIGAFDLAHIAGEAESIDPVTAPLRAARMLRVLNERSELVQAYIEAYLAP